MYMKGKLEYFYTKVYRTLKYCEGGWNRHLRSWKRGYNFHGTCQLGKS
jgi:hypothetical protein